MKCDFKNIILGDRYELIEEIGSGGMAFVYKAMDKRLNRNVAVKILKTEFTDNKDFVQKFSDEAMSAASLTHPNIVSIYDAGYENGIYYIVMELVTGITLKDLIDKKKYIKWKDALSITKQILSAMEVAHKHNIIHRDIKPHNIMLTYDGVAKVADFGIARVVSENTSEAADLNIGSVHYLAPEQAKGDAFDERADLYSIGITLFEMLIGHVPFDGDTAIAVAMKHIKEPITPPCEINPAIPVGVSDFVIKATMKNPDDRFQTAMDMLSSLQVVLLIPNEHLKSLENNRIGYQMNGPEHSPVNKKDISKERFEHYGEPVRRKKRPNKNKMSFSKYFETYYKEIAVASAAAVLSIVIMIVSFGSISGNLTDFRKAEYTVTDFTNMEYSVIAPKLRKLGINVDLSYTASNDVEKGKIISQVPTSGTISAGETITFNVSYGYSDFVIENYGASLTDSRIVENDFRNTGVNIEYVYVYSNSVAKDYVVGTRPGAGEIVNAGDTIYVYKSLGSPPAAGSCGNYVGMALSSAKAAIEAAGYKCTVMEALSPEITDPDDGPDVTPDPDSTMIVTTDSITATPSPTPTPTPESPSTTTPGTSEDPQQPDEPSVLGQYPPVGTILEPGDEIVLYMSEPKFYRTEKTLILEKTDYMNVSSTFDLRIEITPSDTGEKETLFSGTWKSDGDNMPFVFNVYVPHRGTSVVNVYINGEFYSNFIVKSEE